MTKEAGAPVSVTGSDGKSRYPLASELADKNTKIANWRVLGKDEKPQAGDVAAYKLPGGGTAFSGHSGIVVRIGENGAIITIAAHNYANPRYDRVGPQDTQFADNKTTTYRRYIGP